MYFKHGLSGNRLWRVWRMMLHRCSPRANGRSRRNYFERGIRVCEAWQVFEVFQAWAVSNGYIAGLTIERKDNDGNYEAGNCVFIPAGEQARNRRVTRWLEFRGRRLPITIWSQELGLSRSAINQRLKDGWSVERALSTLKVGYPRSIGVRRP